MEAEERPRKQRKLSHDEGRDATNVTATEEMKGEDGDFDSQDLDQKGTQTGGKRTASLEFDDPPQHKKRMDQDGVFSSNEDPNDFETNSDHVREHRTEDDLPAPDETAPLVESMETDGDGPKMSKSQQKKLRKKQEWEAKRDERKIIRKEKMVAKRERRKAERKQQIEESGEQPAPPPVPKPKAQKPVTLPVTFVIDCDFDDLMRDNERISLAAQITRSYSDNKNAMFRSHLTVCSFGGKLRERFDNILTHYKGWRGVRFLDCDFVGAAGRAREWMFAEETGGKLAGVFHHLVSENNEDAQTKLKEQGEVVYLTSEADEMLTQLKPYSTYIIGGLVDKNREKGICYKRATKRGVKTARLPIGEFMDMQSRKVLTTNHVNEIMLKWMECGDWGEAFMKAIPKRKGGKLKAESGKEDDQNEVSEGDDEAGRDDEKSIGDVGSGDENQVTGVEIEDAVFLDNGP